MSILVHLRFWILTAAVATVQQSTAKQQSSLHHHHRHSAAALLQIHVHVSKISNNQLSNMNDTMYEISLDGLTDDVGDRRRVAVTLHWTAAERQTSMHSFCYNGTVQHDVILRHSLSSSWMVALWENRDTLLARSLVHMQHKQPVKTVHLSSSHTVHHNDNHPMIVDDQNDHQWWVWKSFVTVIEWLVCGLGGLFGLGLLSLWYADAQQAEEEEEEDEEEWVDNDMDYKTGLPPNDHEQNGTDHEDDIAKDEQDIVEDEGVYPFNAKRDDNADFGHQQDYEDKDEHQPLDDDRWTTNDPHDTTSQAIDHLKQAYRLLGHKEHLILVPPPNTMADDQQDDSYLPFGQLAISASTTTHLQEDEEEVDEGRPTQHWTSVSSSKSSWDWPATSTRDTMPGQGESNAFVPLPASWTARPREQSESSFGSPVDTTPPQRVPPPFAASQFGPDSPTKESVEPTAPTLEALPTVMASPTSKRKSPGTVNEQPPNKKLALSPSKCSKVLHSPGSESPRVSSDISFVGSRTTGSPTTEPALSPPVPALTEANLPLRCDKEAKENSTASPAHTKNKDNDQGTGKENGETIRDSVFSSDDSIGSSKKEGEEAVCLVSDRENDVWNHPKEPPPLGSKPGVMGEAGEEKSIDSKQDSVDEAGKEQLIGSKQDGMGEAGKDKSIDFKQDVVDDTGKEKLEQKTSFDTGLQVDGPNTDNCIAVENSDKQPSSVSPVTSSYNSTLPPDSDQSNETNPMFLYFCRQDREKLPQTVTFEKEFPSYSDTTTDNRTRSEAEIPAEDDSVECLGSHLLAEPVPDIPLSKMLLAAATHGEKKSNSTRRREKKVEKNKPNNDKRTRKVPKTIRFKSTIENLSPASSKNSSKASFRSKRSKPRRISQGFTYGDE